MFSSPKGSLVAASTTASTCWQRPGALPGSLPKMRSSSSSCCPWRHSMARICRHARCELHVSAVYKPQYSGASGHNAVFDSLIMQSTQAATHMSSW